MVKNNKLALNAALPVSRRITSGFQFGTNPGVICTHACAVIGNGDLAFLRAKLSL